MPQTAPVQRSTSKPETREEMLKYGAYLVRRGRALCQNRDRASQRQGSEYIARGQKLIAKANQTTGAMPAVPPKGTSSASRGNAGQQKAAPQGNPKVVSVQHYARYGAIMNTYELEEPASVQPQAAQGRHAHQGRRQATASPAPGPASPPPQRAGQPTTGTRAAAASQQAARHPRTATPSGQGARTRAAVDSQRPTTRGGTRRRSHVRIVDLDREDAIRQGMEPTRYQESAQQTSRLQQAAMAQQHDMRFRASRQGGPSSRVTVPRPHRAASSSVDEGATRVILDKPVAAPATGSARTMTREPHPGRGDDATRPQATHGRPVRAARSVAPSRGVATTQDVREALAAAEREKTRISETIAAETAAPAAPAATTVGKGKTPGVGLASVTMGLRSFSVFCGGCVFLSYLFIGPWGSQTAMVITLSAGLTTLAAASLLETRATR